MTPFCVLNTTKNALQIMSLAAYQERLTRLANTIEGKKLLQCLLVVSLTIAGLVKAKLGPLYPSAFQLILRYVCHLSFICLTCRPLFSSEPFVLSYIWDKDAKVLLLSHSLYPELQLNRDYENGNLTKYI